MVASKRLRLAIDKLATEGLIADDCLPISGQGVNNSIFKLKDKKKNKYYCLKLYKLPSEIDHRNRFKAEKLFLNYMKATGIRNIPKIIKFSEIENWILMEWIEGVTLNQIDSEKIKQIVLFTKAINREKEPFKSLRAKLNPASECCLYPDQISWQIKNRLERITKYIPKNKIELVANDWINQLFIPSAITEFNKFEASVRTRGHWDNKRIVPIASPSDVGIHNMIQSKKGIFFIDFEYSGLDDLAKLACDWVLQPNYRFSPSQEKELITELDNNLHHIDRTWILRFQDLKPILRKRWTIIMLRTYIEGGLNQRILKQIIEYAR